jgi:hypothetical protein
MGMNSTAMRASIKSGIKDPRAGSEKSIFGKIADMGKPKKPSTPAPAPAQVSGLYDPKTKSNFEEEIKKRKKNPTGGAMSGTGGGYGGSTILG